MRPLAACVDTMSCAKISAVLHTNTVYIKKDGVLASLPGASLAELGLPRNARGASAMVQGGISSLAGSDYPLGIFVFHYN